MAFNKTDAYIELLMKEFPDKVDWTVISNNRFISTDFIEKYGNKLNKYALVRNFNVHPEHIEKWFSEIEIKQNNELFSLNPNLTNTFVKKYYQNEIYNNPYLYTFINLNISEIDRFYTKISDWPTFIENHKDIIILYMSALDTNWASWLEGKGFWHHIGRNPSITPAFIEKFANEIDFMHIKWNPSMNKEFIDKYAKKFAWNNLVPFTKMPYEYYAPYLHFISERYYNNCNDLPAQYLDKFKDMATISSDPRLSIDTIAKCAEKLNWCLVWQNSFDKAPELQDKSEEKPEEKSEEKHIVAYFASFKRFNIIELIENGVKQQLYKTNVSEETWDFLTKEKSYNIEKTDDGIKIDLDDIIILGHKMTYDH